jgi:hypothetical protein
MDGRSVEKIYYDLIGWLGSCRLYCWCLIGQNLFCWCLTGASVLVYTARSTVQVYTDWYRGWNKYPYKLSKQSVCKEKVYISTLKKFKNGKRASLGQRPNERPPGEANPTVHAISDGKARAYCTVGLVWWVQGRIHNAWTKSISLPRFKSLFLCLLKSSINRSTLD